MSSGSSEPTAASFLEQVRRHSNEMSPSERRLADVILDFPGELASYTATEIASLAGVSNATVSRFVRRIGYPSYEAARQQVRIDQQTGAALYLVRPPTDDQDPIAAHLQQSLANLEQTMAKLGQAEIDAIANALINARRVWLVGTRAGRIFADYLGFQLQQVIPTITVAPPAGETLGEHVATMNRDDVVMLFRLRRPNQQFENIIRTIQATGATTIYISDESIARRSDVVWHVQCQTATLGPLFNHVSVMAVCHLLATRVFALSGRTGRRRLTDIESAHEALKDV